MTNEAGSLSCRTVPNEAGSLSCRAVTNEAGLLSCRAVTNEAVSLSCRAVANEAGSGTSLVRRLADGPLFICPELAYLTSRDTLG